MLLTRWLAGSRPRAPAPPRPRAPAPPRPQSATAQPLPPSACPRACPALAILRLHALHTLRPARHVGPRGAALPLGPGLKPTCTAARRGHGGARRLARRGPSVRHDPRSPGARRPLRSQHLGAAGLLRLRLSGPLLLAPCPLPLALRPPLATLLRLCAQSLKAFSLPEPSLSMAARPHRARADARATQAPERHGRCGRLWMIWWRASRRKRGVALLACGVAPRALRVM
jgi:hypothetical protein